VARRWAGHKPAGVFRSGLERVVAHRLKDEIGEVPYETLRIQYEVPARSTWYRPDFILPNGILLEVKGLFEASDRVKHLLIKEQHPELDIRFVFGNAKNKLSKASKTTYAAWCEKYGFLYADKYIPRSWLHEPTHPDIEKIQQGEIKL
jgi:hypothetical protein